MCKWIKKIFKKTKKSLYVMPNYVIKKYIGQPDGRN